MSPTRRLGYIEIPHTKPIGQCGVNRISSLRDGLWVCLIEHVEVALEADEISVVLCVRGFVVAGEELLDPFAVEAGDVLAFDLLGTFGLACVGVGAGAEA